MWNIQEMTGYEPKTTFWMDFSIADRFGLSAVHDTYSRAFKEWRDNYIYLTELVLVLNHKIWQHYQTNEALARLYDKLWRDAAAWACKHLKGEEAEYYYRTLD